MKKPRLHPLLMIAAAVTQSFCAPARPTVKERLDDSERAFSRGQVLLAYRLLRDHRLQGETDPRAVQLNRVVSEAASFIISRFLEKAEELYNQNRIVQALHYFEQLAVLLPPDDPLQENIVRRQRAVREQLENLQKEISNLGRLARADFEAGRLEKARERLKAAQNLAGRYHLSLGLEEELLLVECLRRSPLPGADDVVLEELFQPAPPAEPPPRKKAAPEKPIRPPEAAAPAPDPLSAQTEALLRQASELVRGGSYLEAIETYRRVLKIDPRNSQARMALDELEPVRQRLIKELLEKAAQYFARQDLDRAAPFYEKVLRIDPGNIRAKEGLEMKRRLDELKQKNRPAEN